MLQSLRHLHFRAMQPFSSANEGWVHHLHNCQQLCCAVEDIEHLEWCFRGGVESICNSMPAIYDRIMHVFSGQCMQLPLFQSSLMQAATTCATTDNRQEVYSMTLCILPKNSTFPHGHAHSSMPSPEGNTAYQIHQMALGVVSRRHPHEAMGGWGEGHCAAG